MVFQAIDGYRVSESRLTLSFCLSFLAFSPFLLPWQSVFEDDSAFDVIDAIDEIDDLDGLDLDLDLELDDFTEDLDLM